MRILALVAVLLSASIPAMAAKKTPAKAAMKPLTFKQLVLLAKAKGEASPLDEPRAGKLGYVGQYQMMDYIVADLTKDTQIAILTVLDPKTGSPYDAILTSTTITEWRGEEPISIDGYSYRSDLTGRLISPLRASGKVGEINQEKLDITAAVKQHFEAVKKDLLRTASLPQSTK